jgi:hypothetical protein
VNHPEPNMTIRLSVDRIKGEGKKTAVLLADNGQISNFPRALLPSGSQACSLPRRVDLIPRPTRHSIARRLALGPPRQSPQAKPDEKRSVSTLPLSRCIPV